MRFDQTRYQIFITTQMVKLIMEHRLASEMEALSTFIDTEIYKMICEPELKMWEFAPLAILDMWESEIATGDPRNSLYIRGDEID